MINDPFLFPHITLLKPNLRDFFLGRIVLRRNSYTMFVGEFAAEPA
jgi:hypothetical protein